MLPRKFRTMSPAALSPLPSITPKTLAVVQDLMQRDGLESSSPEQVSLYVERLIARERLFRTVAEIRQGTCGTPEESLLQLIDEAVEEVKAAHQGRSASEASPRQ
jgi:hypothetical protein